MPVMIMMTKTMMITSLFLQKKNNEQTPSDDYNDDVDNNDDYNHDYWLPMTRDMRCHLPSLTLTDHCSTEVAGPLPSHT